VANEQRRAKKAEEVEQQLVSAINASRRPAEKPDLCLLGWRHSLTLTRGAVSKVVWLSEDK
jgi:hypothetical protein